MTSRIISSWKGLTTLVKLVIILGIVALAAVIIVVLRGPTPPPEVIYP